MKINPTIACVVALICSAIFFTSLTRGRKEIKPLSAAEQTQVAANKKKIAPCEDTPAICNGGFVLALYPTKYRPMTMIRCVNSETCLESLLRYKDGTLANIEIILPDDSRWTNMSAQYARQFVQK